MHKDIYIYIYIAEFPIVEKFSMGKISNYLFLLFLNLKEKAILAPTELLS